MHPTHSRWNHVQGCHFDIFPTLCGDVGERCQILIQFVGQENNLVEYEGQERC
jgi:hypothetical protein